VEQVWAAGNPRLECRDPLRASPPERQPVRRFGQPPERAQPFKTALGRIAANQRRRDGADRGTADPIGLLPCPVQRLIGAGQISSKGIAATKNESTNDGNTPA
jgi:hypothetical protein